eukprot:11830032-Alexandrium_andersonii.AAC.1
MCIRDSRFRPVGGGPQPREPRAAGGPAPPGDELRDPRPLRSGAQVRGRRQRSARCEAGRRVPPGAR